MSTVFSIVSALHNLVRWAIVILALVTLFRAYRGWLGKRQWEEADRKMGVYFTSALDTQMLLGILLLLLNGLSLLSNGLLEHVAPMVVGVVVAHGTSAMTRRGEDPVAKQRLAAIGYSLALVIILVSIPWYLRLFPGL